MTLIKSISIPSTPRSKNYPQGAVIYKSQGGGAGAIMSSDPDKLDKSLFDTIFEIIRIGAQLKLRVKGDLYADGGVSSLGIDEEDSAGATGLDYDALRVLLTDSVNAYEINAAFLSAINYAYINNLISSVYATQSFVTTKINDLINGAPTAYDTLKEIADVLASNVNSINDLLIAIGTKLPASSYTASDVLAKLLTVDGAGTGLDSDLLDGKEGSYYTGFADAAVNNLKIGGANLIPNSGNIANISQKQLLGTFTHNVLDPDGGNNATQITYDRANGFFRIGNADTSSILKISNNTYTFSTFIYPLVGSQVKMAISGLDPILINLIAGKWQRISITGTMVEGAWYDAWRFVDITSVNSGDSFNIYHPKVEVGTKATDWVRHIQDETVLGPTWKEGEDSNGDLVFYKNGVAIAKLTDVGFVSLKGVTALGV